MITVDYICSRTAVHATDRQRRRVRSQDQCFVALNQVPSYTTHHRGYYFPRQLIRPQQIPAGTYARSRKGIELKTYRITWLMLVMGGVMCDQQHITIARPALSKRKARLLCSKVHRTARHSNRSHPYNEFPDHPHPTSRHQDGRGHSPSHLHIHCSSLSRRRHRLRPSRRRSSSRQLDSPREGCRKPVHQKSRKGDHDLAKGEDCRARGIAGEGPGNFGGDGRCLRTHLRADGERESVDLISRWALVARVPS